MGRSDIDKSSGKVSEMMMTGEAISFVEILTDEHFARPYEMRNLYLSR